MTYIIKDWASNVLNYKGRFERPCFAVPMTFESFDDAWAWLYNAHSDSDENCMDDFFVDSIDDNK